LATAASLSAFALAYSASTCSLAFFSASALSAISFCFFYSSFILFFSALIITFFLAASNSACSFSALRFSYLSFSYLLKSAIIISCLCCAMSFSAYYFILFNSSSILSFAYYTFS